MSAYHDAKAGGIVDLSERRAAGIPPKGDDSEATVGERSVESTQTAAAVAPSEER